MYYLIKKHQIKDRFGWMILTFLIPTQAAIILYFMEMLNITNLKTQL